MPALPASRANRTSLLVIGAGPYGVAVAAYARARGIDTVIAGHRMALWRRHMPPGMFLRSSIDWHLDAAGEHTFEAFGADRRIAPSDIEPVPIAVFLDYADWFVAQKRKGCPAAASIIVGDLLARS